MTDDGIYIELLTALIKSKIKLMGKLAVTKAKEIDKLTVNDDGQVMAFQGNPVTIFTNLLDKYKATLGRGAVTSAKLLYYNLKEKYPEFTFPKELDSFLL